MVIYRFVVSGGTIDQFDVYLLQEVYLYSFGHLKVIIVRELSSVRKARIVNFPLRRVSFLCVKKAFRKLKISVHKIRARHKSDD